LPLPAGLILLTPALDLTESSDSMRTNRDLDVVLKEPFTEFKDMYVGDHDPKDPYVSPLFGDFGRGFPHTFLQTGTRDLYLSDTVRMHRALRKAGIPVDLHVFEALPHGFAAGTPEQEDFLSEVRRFIDARLKIAG
jgi:acetyl esterase/lipase